VQVLQRLQHGGGYIGAASHGFGEDDIGTRGQQALGSRDEIGEAAAEAGSGDFAGINAGGHGLARIHERTALIVGNYGGAHAALL
jgi:hypothetical protein